EEVEERSRGGIDVDIRTSEALDSYAPPRRSANTKDSPQGTACAAGVASGTRLDAQVPARAPGSRRRAVAFALHARLYRISRRAAAPVHPLAAVPTRVQRIDERRQCH